MEGGDEPSQPLRQCLDLDKFVAVPTEGLLVATALELLENHTYWAGIVFENLGLDASDAPPHVKYKIRMDIDEVEGTKKLKDRCVPVTLQRPNGSHSDPWMEERSKRCLTATLACPLKVVTCAMNKEMS